MASDQDTQQITSLQSQPVQSIPMTIQAENNNEIDESTYITNHSMAILPTAKAETIVNSKAALNNNSKCINVTTTINQYITAKKRLDAAFFRRDAVTVSKELLGKVIVRKTSDGIMRAKIVETEA